MEQITAYFRAFDCGDIVALWGGPDGRGFISSYQHVGQHSDASPELIDELRSATKSEKAPLLAELRRIGYDVVDADKITGFFTSP